MKTFFLNLYCSWFEIAVLVTVIVIYLTHNLVWLTIPVFSWSSLYLLSEYKITRFITWPLHKSYFHRFLTRKMRGIAGMLVVYPMLIWLHTEGKKIYIEKGLDGLRDGMICELDKINGILKLNLDDIQKQKKQNEKPTV